MPKDTPQVDHKAVALRLLTIVNDPDATRINVELETTTPSGRVWDEDRQLWTDPSDPPAVEAQSTQPRTPNSDHVRTDPSTGEAARLRGRLRFEALKLFTEALPQGVARDSASEHAVRYVSRLFDAVFPAPSDSQGGQEEKVRELEEIRANLHEALRHAKRRAERAEYRIKEGFGKGTMNALREADDRANKAETALEELAASYERGAERSKNETYSAALNVAAIRCREKAAALKGGEGR